MLYFLLGFLSCFAIFSVLFILLFFKNQTFQEKIYDKKDVVQKEKNLFENL